MHVLDGLGYNTGAISDMADIVADYLERTALDEVTIVAHSKGGLIAKHALRDPATLARVRHVIAVNTPFSGSSYASWFLLPSVRMFAPNGPVIRALSVELAVNHASARCTASSTPTSPRAAVSRVRRTSCCPPSGTSDRSACPAHCG